MKQINDIAGLAVALLTLAGVLWALVRFANRPRLFCGVPPSTEEARAKGISPKKIGTAAVAGAFRHRHRALARRLWGGRRKRTLSRRDRTRCRDPLRCRSLKRRADGTVGLPILVVNQGGRAAASYTANVAVYDEQYRPGLHLLDLFTEGLEFGLYAAEPERLGCNVRKKAQITTPRPIIEDYVAYMGEGIGRYGDWVFLWGTLDGSSYELIHADLSVAPETDHFYLVFFLDSADSWIRAKQYIQRVNIEPADGPPAMR